MSAFRSTKILCIVVALACCAASARTAFGTTASRLTRASPVPVRLCVAVPRSLPALTLLSQGVLHAVSLAQQDFSARLRTVGVRLEPPLVEDYGTASGPNELLAAKGARTCVARADTVAYIGPVNSDAALPAEPILNRGGMLTISPSTTLPTLTDPGQRAIQEPATFTHRLPYVTYYRVIAPDSIQGLAGVQYLSKHLGAKSYYLVDDQSPYGRLIVGTLEHRIGELGIQQVGSAHLDMTSPVATNRSIAAIADQTAAIAPDALYCACGYADVAARLARALVQRGFSGRFLGPDALLGNSPQPSARAFATNIGLDSAHAPPSFQRRYKARFHTAPQYYDALAYDAARIAVQAIYNAASHHRLTGPRFTLRGRITRYAASICYRGVTGTTTFDRNGDTRNQVVSIYAASHGRWAFAGTQRIGQQPACHKS